MEEKIVPVTISLSTGAVSARRVVVSSGQTTGYHVSMSNRIGRGNCVSYGGHACCSSGAQWSIIVTGEIISYRLFTYVGARRSSTSSLKHDCYSRYDYS